MTSFYSWRQFLMTFHGPYRGAKEENLRMPTAMRMRMTSLFRRPWAWARAQAVGSARIALIHARAAVRACDWRAVRGRRFCPLVHRQRYCGLLARHDRRRNGHSHAGQNVPVWVEVAPFVLTVIGFLIAYYYYVLHPDLPPRMAAREGPALHVLLQ